MPNLDNTCIGEIRIWPSFFAPVGWLFCHGQILSIVDYELLFSLIGTTYGGDGIQNFRLPDLRGRMAAGVGAAPGLAENLLGQYGGEPDVVPQPSQVAAGADVSGISLNGNGAGDNRQPFMALNFIIAYEGNYPQRP